MNSVFIIDASVILKWYLEEELQEKAFLVRNDFSAGKIGLVAPKYALVEVANRMERHPGFQAKTLLRLDSFLETRPVQIEDLIRSFELVRLQRKTGERHFTVYDAIYVQLALMETMPLLTADEAQARAARRAGCRVTLLKDYA